MSLHLSPPPIALPPHSKSFSPLLHSPSLFRLSLPFSVSQILHNPIRFWMLRTEPKPRARERTAGTPQPQGHREARKRGGGKGEGFRAFSDLDSTTTETRRFSNSSVNSLVHIWQSLVCVWNNAAKLLSETKETTTTVVCMHGYLQRTNQHQIHVYSQEGFQRVHWDIDHKKF
jgi:hypothetical protein